MTNDTANPTTDTTTSVIAATLRAAASSGESCEMKARWICEALAKAGYVTFKGHPHT